MLIRVSGGTDGIKQYLESGKKAGRNLHRDELDERVVLAGDLDLVDSVIQSKAGHGERYLHLTLSFKEDHLSREQLQGIVEEFKKFAFAAYDTDEYTFYAEAHLPRQKALPNRENGGVVERKPHIHIVVPAINLLSCRNLSLFGRVAHNTVFLDCWQEYINCRFGLASPKTHRRPLMGGPAGVLARHKGDLFGGKQRAFKRRLLELLMERGVESFTELEQLLSALGEVRIRNAGKPGEYLNFKPWGHNKGFNLKDFVFTRGFCDLPMEEKRQRLAEEPGGDEYQEPGEPIPSPAQMEATLREWYDVRSKEIKYINSGSRLYKRYRQASPAERSEILEECRTAFYDRLRKVRQGKDIQDPGGPLTAPIAMTSPTLGTTGRSSDSLISQLSRDAREQANKPESLHRLINLRLDARRLLAELGQSHGVVAGKYGIVKGRDGGDRIVCGRRHLNPADFLGKELHLPWAAAKPILEAVYARQQDEAPIPPVAPTPSAQLWRDFNAARSQRAGTIKQAWLEQRASERIRREAIKTDFQATRARVLADPRLSPAERRAQQSLARMLRLQQESALRMGIAGERARLGEQGKTPLEQQYQAYLQYRATTGDTHALAELRRMEGKDGGTGASDPALATLHGTPVGDAVELLAGLSYEVAVNGDVTYSEQGVPVLVDQARAIRVLLEADANIEMGLRLAIARFGRNLDISGPTSFRQAVARIVVAQGLDVNFTDPALQEQIAMMRTTDEKERQAAAERRAAYQRAAQEKKRQETLAHLDQVKQDARRIDLPGYLMARGLRLRKEGKGWMTEAEPRWHFFLGQEGQWMARQGDDYVDAIGFMQRTEGLAFREAVEALAGRGGDRLTLPSSSQAAARAQAAPLTLREPSVEQRRQAGDYATRERGISLATLQSAIEAGFVAADDCGVAFLGRDCDGQVRSIETRFLVARTIQGELTSKRSYTGSDKTFPPVLPGNLAEVHIVEGGFDALALHDMARRRGTPPPTVIVTGGARVLKWLDNPDIQHLLGQADLVVQQRDREMQGKEADAGKQAQTDAAYAAQLERLASIIGKGRVSARSPAQGFKDVAEQNLHEAISSAHRQPSDNSGPDLT